MMLKIDPLNPNRHLLKQADECLANGGLVVFPTETVYGLAADPAVAGAEQRIYQAKGRPSDKPVARFIRTLEALPRDGVTLIPEIERLAARFWPGPLTLVLQAGEQWIGYRMPDHPLALALLDQVGRSLAVTSANRSGEPAARTAEDAAAQIGENADLILDGGPCGEMAVSTVLRVGTDEWTLLRAGAFSEEMLRKGLE